MQKVTVSLDTRHIYELRAQQRLGNASSRSEALRHLLNKYERIQSEYEALHTEYEDLEAEYEELHTRYEAREDRIEELETQLRGRSRVEDLPTRSEASKPIKSAASAYSTKPV